MELTKEQKEAVSRLVQEGKSLADVQTYLQSEHKLSLTYMEVRFLVDDLNLDVKDPEIPEHSKSQPSASDPDTPDLAADSAALGSVSISVDKVTRPGAFVSGEVTFKDGVTSGWQIDQMGRLGVIPKEKGYKPSDEDLREFQQKLQETLERHGI